MESVLNNEKPSLSLVVVKTVQHVSFMQKHFKEVELVTFNYGQRHDTEIEVAKQIAQDQGMKHHVLDMSLLSQLTPNALTQHDMEITNNEDGIPNTFVPARNLLFLSFAGALAYQIGLSILLQAYVKQTFQATQTVAIVL